MKQVKIYKKDIFVLVDDKDFKWISNYSLTLSSHGYPQIRNKLRSGYLHSLIMETPKGLTTDHINGNKLDNRRENLRVCTQKQNATNQTKQQRILTSQYKGVYLNQNKKWTAQIKLNQKAFNLGSFSTELSAAMAYDIAAKDLFGRYAKLNFS
jgi:hypothetical protein